MRQGYLDASMVGVGIGLMVVAFLLLLFGFALGKEAASDDCRSFGAFKNGRTQFECKPVNSGE